MSQEKLVPEIRFSGFEGEWEETALGSLMDFSNGINAKKNQYGKGRKMISVLDILSSRMILYENIDNSVEIENEERYKVEKGDLLFVRSSETVDEVGMSKAYLEDEYALYSGFTIRGKKKFVYNPYFLELQINSTARSQIERKAGGSTRFNVGQNILSSVQIKLPSLNEQEKTGQLFQQIDTVIDLQAKLVEENKRLKKSLLQKMFPKEGEAVPEIRFAGFEGEWEEYRIEEILDYYGSGGTPTSSNEEYYNGNIPFLSITDITNSKGTIYATEKTITEEGLENSAAWIVPKGSVSLAMYASVGKVAMLGIDLATSQAFFNMIVSDEFDVEYVYQYLKKMEINHEWRFIIETGTQSNLNATNIKQYKIKIPSLPEQSKIGSFFQTLDQKIQKEEEKLETYKKLKDSLLQKMFV